MVCRFVAMFYKRGGQEMVYLEWESYSIPVKESERQAIGKGRWVTYDNKDNDTKNGDGQ
jgi:hypothetical protein